MTLFPGETMAAAPNSILLFLPHLDVSGGLGVHCRMLLAALNEVALSVHFTVACPADPPMLFPTTAPEPFDRGSVAASKFTFRTITIPTGFNLANPLDAILRDVISATKPDLLYCSYYTGMLSPPCPQIVAFHDAGFLENPKGFGGTAEIRRRTIETIRPAINLIQCISGDARDRICRRLPWDREKTEVVWHALPDSTELLAAASSMPAESIAIATTTAAALQPYFFLPVGAATGFNRIRKNVPNAVRAFRMLPDGVANLVIAGTATLTDKVLSELLPPEIGRVVNGCFISNDERVIIVPTLDRLPFLAAMRHAVAVVYPSRYEGFGLPTLEAMALGVPLIACNATSIPEIVADAGLLVDPDSVPDLSAAMLQLLNREDVRNYLIRRGRERIDRFTLSAMGTAMDAMFRGVLASP